jgi:hypothetical protein
MAEPSEISETSEERELLADLKRVCEQRALFVLEFETGQLSAEAEEAYGWRLVDAGEGLLRHARRRKTPSGSVELAQILVEGGS